MKKTLLIVSASFAMLALLIPGFAVHQAHARTIKVKESLVKDACQGKLQSGGGNFGCTRTCNKTLCDYNCEIKKGKTNCRVLIVRTTPGGSATPPKAGGGAVAPTNTGTKIPPQRLQTGTVGVKQVSPPGA